MGVKCETTGFINLHSNVQQSLQVLEEWINIVFLILPLLLHWPLLHVYLSTEWGFSQTTWNVNEEFDISLMLPSDVQREAKCLNYILFLIILTITNKKQGTFLHPNMYIL